MHLKIVARSSDDTGPNLSWKVDIYTDNQLIQSSLRISDPLDGKEQGLCRWYFDAYRQKEPYSFSRAKAAETLLRRYGLNLSSQLRLDEILQKNDPVLLEIEDGYDSNSDEVTTSIQQLYWEFLEDRNLYDSSITVRVQRRVKSRKSMVLDALVPRTGFVRLLLVTARDLRREWTADGEVSPSLVSDILWNIKDRLSSQGRKEHMQIEVVRPATFEALKSHLSNRSTHGPLQYDIIHLDMHGTIRRQRDGPAKGYLHFSHPKSLETEAVPVDAVVSLFDEHHVSNFVINACDSGRAAFPGANMAQLFAQSGPVNVLGMAHKASESATAKLLECFYMSLLLDKMGFLEASAKARKLLQEEPMRDARFRLQIPVIDWVVPVVYTSKIASAESLIPSPTVCGSHMEAFNDSNLTTVIGREFDVLRVEKEILRQGLLYIHGGPGVGKTAFLRHVASLWRRSDFVSQIVFIDFSDPSMTILSAVSERIGYQVDRLSEELAAMRLNEKIEGAIENSTDDESRAHRVAIVLDGLMDRSKLLLGSDCSASQILKLVKDLLFAPLGHGGHDSFMVLSGRRKLSEATFRDMGFPCSTYELEGLDNAEAISLIHRLYPEQQLPRQQEQEQQERREQHVRGADLNFAWKAEPLASLFKGNPAGLHSFLSLAKESDISLSELYDIIHSEDLVQSLLLGQLLPKFGQLAEFIEYCSHITDETMAVWAMLAWYWHIGPMEKAFAELLGETKIIDTPSKVFAAIDEAESLGYVERGEDEDEGLLWIHPLFTIFTRIVACSMSPRFQPLMPDDWTAFRRSFGFSRTSNIVAHASIDSLITSGPTEGPLYAIRLLVTLLSTHSGRDLDPKYWGFLIHFSISTNKQARQAFVDAVSHGDREPQAKMLEYARHCQENYLFIIKICLGRGLQPIPWVVWPMDMIDMTWPVSRLQNSAQLHELAERLETLLNGALLQCRMSSGSWAIKPDDLRVVLRFVSILAEIHRHHISEERHNERQVEFVEMGDKLLKESEQEWGIAMDPSVMATKAMHDFSAAFAMLDQHRPEESRKRLRSALQAFRGTSNEENPLSAERWKKFIEERSARDVAFYQGYLDTAEGREKKIEDVWNLALSEAMGYDMKDVDNGFSNEIAEASHPMDDSWDFMLRYHRQMTSATSRLDNYEQEIDRGHWLRALGHHSGMMVRSVKQLDFHEIHGHLDAQEAIAKQHGAPDITLDRIRVSRKGMTMMEDMISVEDVKKLTPEHYEQFDRYSKDLQRHGFDSTYLNKISNISRESLTRDADPNLVHNQGPGILIGHGGLKNFASSILAKHVDTISRNRDYAYDILRAMASSLEILTWLEDAEDENRVPDIYKYLVELETLLKEDALAKEFINASGVEERHDWNSRRLLRDVLLSFQKIDGDGGDLERRLEESQGNLQRVQQIVMLDGREGVFEEILTTSEQLTQAIRIGVETRRAYDAKNKEHDESKFLRLAAETIEAFKEGQFALAVKDDEENLDMLHELWSEHNLISIAALSEQKRWKAAHKLFKEWKSNKAVWKAFTHPEKKAASENMAYAARDMAHLTDFWGALRRLDLPATDRSLNRLRQMAKTAEEKKHKTMLSKSLLSVCERTRSKALQLLFTFGPGPASEHVVGIIQTMADVGFAFGEL